MSDDQEIAYLNFPGSKYQFVEQSFSGNTLSRILQNEKRSLATNTCPEGTLLYPIIFGGSPQDCSQDVIYDGFNTDANSNLVMTGSVDITSPTSTCPIHSSSGVIPFILYSEYDGKVQWIKILGSNPTAKILSPIFVGVNIYAVVISQTSLRISKIEIASGNILDEQSMDDIFASGSTSNMILKSDTNSDLYLMMNLKSSYYGYSDQEGILIRMNQALTGQWLTRTHGSSSKSGDNYYDLDFAIGTTSLWKFTLIYTGSASFKFVVDKIQKSDATQNLQSTWSNPLPTTIQGQIKLNSDQSKWFTVGYIDTTDKISFQQGITATNTISSSYVSNILIKSFDFEINSNEDLVISGIQNIYQILILNVKSTDGSIIVSKIISKGSSTPTINPKLFLRRPKAGQVLFAFQNQKYIDATYPSRLIIFNSSDILSDKKQSCVNFTTIVITNFNSVGTSGSTSSSTLLFNPTITTLTLAPLISDFIDSAQSPVFYYGLRDLNPLYKCRIPITVTPAELLYDFETQVTQNISQVLSVQSCLGKVYTITSITQFSGSALDSTKFTFDAIASKLFVKLLDTDQADYVGLRHLKLTASYSGDQATIFLRLVGLPPSKYVQDPQNPNHDISNCTINIYPFYYGHTFKVQTNFFDIDQNGNLLFAGQGTNTPFGMAGDNSIGRGFLSSTDQRSKPYWIYKVEPEFSPATQTQCFHINQYQEFVYGLCQSKDYYFQSFTSTPILLKLKHMTGQIIYVKNLPLSQYSPTTQTPLIVKGLQTGKILILQKFSDSTKSNFAGIKFEDTNFNIDFFKFYQSSVTYIDSDFLIDETVGFFYQFSHGGSSNEEIYQFRLADGVLIQKSKLDSGQADSYGVPNYYGTDKLLVPYIQDSPNKLICYVIKKSDLSSLANIEITFTASTTIRSAAATSDSIGNIYLSGSKTQSYFIKLDSNYQVIEQRFWNHGSNNYLMATSKTYNDEIFYVLTGTYLTGTYSSTMIFRGLSSDINCFEIPILTSTTTTYYPIINILNTATIVTPLIGLEIDFPYLLNDNFPVFPDTNSIKFQTQSFSSDATKRNEWGEQGFQNYQKRYPYDTVNCNQIAYIEDYRHQPQVDIVKGDIVTINLESMIKNCQSREFGVYIRDPFSNTQSFKNTFVTGVNNSAIKVDSSGGTAHSTVFVNVHYYDIRFGIGVVYTDHPMLIRIIPVAPLQLSKSNLTYCAQNPFPFSYGHAGCNGGCEMYLSTIFVNQEDSNILVAGQAGKLNAHVINDDGNDDAFVMRVSETGWTEWYTQLSVQRGYDDKATSVTIANDYVYAFMYGAGEAPQTRKKAIVKLEYGDGKLLWAKFLKLINPVDSSILLSIGRIGDIIGNPWNQSQILFSIRLYYENYSKYYGGNIMISDNNVNVTNDFLTLVLSPAKPSSTLPLNGQIVFDPDENYVYTGFSSYITSSSSIDTMVLKQNTTTGNIEWSRTYNNGVNYPANENKNVPALAFNNKTKFLFVAQADGYAHLVKISQNGGTSKRIQVKIGPDGSQLTVYIVIDESTGNTILGGNFITSNSFNIVTLSENLDYISGSYEGHYTIYSAMGRQMWKVNDYIILAHNIYQFWSPSYYGNEIIFQKKSIDFQLYNYKHECHSYALYAYFQQRSLYTNDNTTVNSAAIYISTQKQIIFNEASVKSYQLQTIGQKIFGPQSDNGHVYWFQGTRGTVHCNVAGLTYPSRIDLDPIEVTIGQIVEYPLSLSVFKQCQGYITSYSSLQDEADSTSRSATNNYITMTQTKITIDATNSPPYPGYRKLKIGSVCSLPSRCWTVGIPIIIWPKTEIKDAPRIPPSQVCLQPQNYPKLLGHPNYDLTLTDADLDLDSGNYIACGANGGATDYQTKQYNTGYAQGFILMSDINGKILWFYASTHTLSIGVQQFSACRFSNDKYIHSLFLNNDMNIVGMIKQDYERGRVIYIKLLPGYYYSQEYFTKIFMDKFSNYAYVAAKRNDQGTLPQYFMKLDISGENAIHVWSALSTFGGQNSDHRTHSVDVSQDYVFAMNTLYRGADNIWYFQITKYNKNDGKMLVTKHYPQVVINYYYFAHILVDQNRVYTSTSHEGASVNQTKSLRSFDLNLNPLQGVVFRQLTKTSYYFAAIDCDEDYIYELFSSAEKKEYPTEVNWYPALQFSCTGQKPTFKKQLENILINLPSDPVEYQFDWPTDDCNQNIINFTSWSVDRMSTIPTFIQVTNTSSTVTVKVTPTATDVGTYQIRARFQIIGKPSVIVDGLIIVDIYPKIPYGSDITSEECASKVTPAIFEKTDSILYYSDMDSTGDNFLICGSTKASALGFKTNYLNSFIAVYYRFIALKFHLTFDLGQYNALSNLCQFGYQDMIYSIHQIQITQTSFSEGLVLFRHTNIGKYQNSKTIRTDYFYFKSDHYWVDPDNGDQYLSGRLNQMQNIYMSLAGFIARLSYEYNLIFFKIYQTYQEIEARKFEVDTNNNYIYWVFGYTLGNRWYWGITKHAQDDGSYAWARTLINPSNTYITRPTDYQNQIPGLLLTITHLYSCLPYEHNNDLSSQEFHFTQHQLSDGTKLRTIELMFPFRLAIATSIIYLQQSTNFVYLFSGYYQSNCHIFVFDISNPNSLGYKVHALRINGGSFPFGQMFDRNGKMWFSVYDGIPSTKILVGKSIDFTGFTWDQGCSYFVTNSNYLPSMGSPPYGTDGDQSNLWRGLVIYYETDLSQVLYDTYTNVSMDFRVLHFNNRSASIRTQYSDCYQYSNPGLIAIADRIGEPSSTNLGGFAVGSNNYTMMIPKFTQCGNYPLQYTIRISPNTALPAFMSIDLVNMILMVSPWDSAFINTYKIRVTAYLTESPSNLNYTEFNLQIYRNEPPFTQNFDRSAILYAHHNKTWQINLDYDKELDEAKFSVSMLNSANTTITVAWLALAFADNQGMEFTIDNPPQPQAGVNSTQYYIKVNISDQFNLVTPNLQYINLKILRNFSPYLTSGVNQTIESIFITKSFIYTVWYQNFTDLEGDTILISCQAYTNALNKDWTFIEVNKTIPGNITFYGDTPRDNQYAGDYVFMCITNDQYDATPHVYNFTLKVMAKEQIQISLSLTKVSFRLPNTQNLTFFGFDSDPQNEPNYYTLYINNTKYTTKTYPWLYWNNLTLEIYAHPFSNSQGGNHSISVRYDDYISLPCFLNFTLEVIQNWPLRPLIQLPIIMSIANNWFYYNFDKNQIYINPEGEPFSIYFREKDQIALPYFISRNYSNGTIGGYTTESNVGVYQLECVGIDDAFWETSIPLILYVKPCYYKCLLCWDSDYNTCQTCQSSYFFYKNECLEKCIKGTYHNRIDWICSPCPNDCTECTGPDPLSKCQVCRQGIFKLGDGCYKQCPTGYYGDKADSLCKKCNSACNSCFGPTSLQCYNCSEAFKTNEKGIIYKSGYILSKTECRTPKCIDGKYYQWDNQLTDGIHLGKCETCNSNCKKCIGPYDTDCIQCYAGNILDPTEFKCVTCEEIPGYFTNEENECEDICGDGIVTSKQCDDGNTRSGDGCSQQCQIEFGYACIFPNQTCKEIVPPQMSVKTITPLNLIYVEFSEPILITSFEALSDQNLDVQIQGQQLNYIFNWRVVTDTKNLLVPDRPIQRFQIKLSDMKQSLEGTETIKILLKNYTSIQDYAGNPLIQDSFASVNPYPYIYLNPNEASTASSGGQSLKYTFISVFSFNLALKIVMNSSMQFLWGLVHALQVFNFLLYMNINFPENVELFSNYLKVASGDIDELNKFIPNIGDYIIDEDKVNEPVDNEKLQQKFQNDNISPYFIIAFGQKLTLWCIGLLIILPFALLLHKLCKNVKVWDGIIGFFFFNGPLRTFIEMYIELIMQVVINTQFIKYRNMSQIITTLTAFAFGAISLLLPFLTMTKIYINRKIVNKRSWLMSLGMLTDDLKRKSIVQLYYYPLFMYQRLMIAGIIVYLYDSPLNQCLAVAACNLIMMFYLVTVKPFKSESQQATTVIDEFVIMICVFVFIELNSTDLTQNDRKNYGWVLIFLILISVCKNFGVVVYFGVKSTREKLRKMFQQEDNQKDSIHSTNSSENEKDSLKIRYDTFDALNDIMNEDSHKQWSQQTTTRINSKSKMTHNNYRRDSISLSQIGYKSQRDLFSPKIDTQFQEDLKSQVKIASTFSKRAQKVKFFQQSEQI